MLHKRLDMNYKKATNENIEYSVRVHSSKERALEREKELRQLMQSKKLRLREIKEENHVTNY